MSGDERMCGVRGAGGDVRREPLGNVSAGADPTAGGGLTVTDSLVVPGRLAAVRAVLVDVGGVAAWNPAFSRMSAEGSAVVGRAYPVTVRGILPGEVRYLKIGERRIETSWTFPGFAERSEWLLEPVAGGTRVTHSFTHTGAVAALLSRGFATAAALRLGRLREEVLRREVARRAA